ncbi:HAD hydrolase, family IIA protein [Toxoplasma gondii VEG]|uniref:HAD hydrolase, family IIA protein n=3 Tax=Toxoplasma gondii TaxID=5811 RepID=V4Z0N6_TOXGV|nr:HAD hydrolase, family IIA protein [Toxoplasma gondii VEG]KFG33359.1 HAD hydrolase, family IIA protein [Toxoplasma gondii p89]
MPAYAGMSAAARDPACGVVGDAPPCASSNGAMRSLGQRLSRQDDTSGSCGSTCPAALSPSGPEKLHSLSPRAKSCLSDSAAPPSASPLTLTRTAVLTGSVTFREVPRAGAEATSNGVVTCICSECVTRLTDGCCARCGRECVSAATSTVSPAKRARKELRPEDAALSATAGPCSNGNCIQPCEYAKSALVAACSGSSEKITQSASAQVPANCGETAKSGKNTFPAWWSEQREQLLGQQRRLASALPSIHPTAFTAEQAESLDALTRHGYRVISGATAEPFADFVDRYDNFIFDVDGVLVMGSQQFAGAPAALQALRQRGKRVIFFTNGASKSRRTCVALLRKAGFEAHEDEMICTSYAAAEYMRLTHPHVKKVMVIGECGLKEEFREAGMVAVTAEEHASSPDAPSPAPSISSERDFLDLTRALDPSVGAVVVGWDRQLSYVKLCLASLYLQRNNGALPFIAANRDAYDVIGGAKMPANGAAVAALELCSSRQAVCVGKPSAWLVQFLFSKYNLDPSRTVVCGDRLDTDIAFGKCAGIDSCVVLTGCTTVEHLVGMPPTHPSAPTVVLPHVGLLQTLKYADTSKAGVVAERMQNGDHCA